MNDVEVKDIWFWISEWELENQNYDVQKVWKSFETK
jgi:hypothetical protein